tara:strand:- start:482 stop:658 length:177 start_codon:yes stop_codon:yes gene_type:complete
MKVGDLVRLTTNANLGLGIVIGKEHQKGSGMMVYRIQWADGRITTGGKIYMEVLDESR